MLDRLIIVTLNLYMNVVNQIPAIFFRAHIHEFENCASVRVFCCFQVIRERKAQLEDLQNRPTVTSTDEDDFVGE